MDKQFMQRVSRLLPSSLASCHFRNVPDVIDSSILVSRNSQPKPNILPDSFHSSITPPQPKPKPKPKPQVSVSNITKNISSSNNSGWFSSEQEEDQLQEALIDPDPETETMFSLSSLSSSSSSSEGSLLNPDACRKTSENKGRSCDHTVMGYSPSLVSDGSAEFSRKTAWKSHRKSSASSCNLYYSDFGSFRREAIQTHRGSCDKVLGCCSFDKSGGGAAENPSEFSRKSTQKPHRQTTQSEPRSEESSQVSSTISTDLGSFRRKTSYKNNKQRSTKNLSDGKVSSMSLTHLYYSDFGSFRRETTNPRRKTRKRVGKKLSYGKVGESYAVEKSSRDPYNDFRISMVEMIVEKQIFREEELGKLLECFLSLNSSYHHDIISKVFLEVCTNLFTQ